MEDWARFKMKYNLPITLIYPGVNKIDFNEITNKVNKKIEIKKKDYSKYLVELINFMGSSIDLST